MARKALSTQSAARNRQRLILCLALPLLALLSSTLFTHDGGRGRAQESAPRRGQVQTETTTVPGLRRVIFTTPAGNKIFVNLPDDFATGETASGTVFAEPASGTGATRPTAGEEFRGYSVEILDKKIPATGGSFELNVTPTALKDGAIEIVLRSSTGADAGRASLPVAPSPAARPADVLLPAFGKSGDFLTFDCPCDGLITDEDFVKVADTKILIVSESRGRRVAFNNSPGTGPAVVEFGERGRVTKGRIRNLGIRMSAKKSQLRSGERTTLTIEVSGLEGLSEPAPLSLQNITPDVVALEPSNTQRLSITPADVRGDVYKTERTLTGIRPGTFRIEAVVSRDSERAPEQSGTPVVVIPPLPATPSVDVAAQFERGQEWTRLRDELMQRIREGKLPPPPRPEVVLVAPEVGAQVREAPTFRWRRVTVSQTEVQKVYYTLRLFEVLPEQSRAEEILKNAPLLEQPQLTEESFRPPAGRAEFSPGKLYAWDVAATDLGGTELARSKLSVFAFGPFPPFNICWLFDAGPVFYCVNQGAGVTVAYAITLGGGGAMSWTLTPQSSADPPVSGTSATVTIPPSLLPTTPGPHTYTLTLTKGTCTRIMSVTVYAYPAGAVGGAAVVSTPQICDGGTAVLDVQGETGSVGQWEYSDDGGASWSSATNAFFIAGAPANTNQMSPSSCAAPNWYTDRMFRAVVSTSNDANAPNCSRTYSTPTTLRIYCRPQAGSVTASTQRFCRFSPPPNITLQMSGTVIGNITWQRSTGGPINGTGNQVTVAAPTQTTTYWAAVSTGGSCPAVNSNFVTVIVDDQPNCASPNPLSAFPTTICPGDASTLTLNSCQGYVTWFQSPTGLPGSWGSPISAGNTVQNTTDLFATTFWQAVISGPPGTTCPPILSNVVKINIMTPPAAPVVATPPPACFGSNVTLNANPPPAGVTYQWYFDDIPVCSGGPTCTVPAEPGTYWVEASNGCQTVRSNVVTLPVEVIKVWIQAPCCRTTGPVNLSASALSSLTGTVGGGQFTWYDQNTGTVIGNGPSVTVNPSVTTTYCVRVKSPTVANCSASTCTTITVCP